jgi:hypothetical protein
MKAFYCLIYAKGAVVPELALLDVYSLAEALARVPSLLWEWPDMMRLDLFTEQGLVDSFYPEQLTSSRAGSTGGYEAHAACC